MFLKAQLVQTIHFQCLDHDFNHEKSHIWVLHCLSCFSRCLERCKCLSITAYIQFVARGTALNSACSKTTPWMTCDVMGGGRCSVHAVLTMGAPGVPQLVGATCGIQLAPPVSFFSLIGSLKEIKHRIQLRFCFVVFSPSSHMTVLCY